MNQGANMTTLIQWTHLQSENQQYVGDSFNPLLGCRAVSPGCANCYAITVTRDLEKRFGINRFGVVDPTGLHWNYKIAFSPKAVLAAMSKSKKPKAYFVCSLSDFALGNNLDCDLLKVDDFKLDHPYGEIWKKYYQPKPASHSNRVKLDFYRDTIIAAICYAYYDNPSNKFLILTKRPEVLSDYLSYLTENSCTMSNRLSAAIAWLFSVNEQNNDLPKKFKEVLYQQNLFDFLRNAFKVSALKVLKNSIWFGTTVEEQKQINRIDILQSIPWGQKKFVSAEPLLGELAFTEKHKFDWLILGGESGDKVRKTELHFMLNTIKNASDLPCRPAIFVKQLGKELGKEYPSQDKKGGNFDAMPEILRIREFPVFE